MPESIRVLYIDDQIDTPGRDGQKIKELLEASGEISCELRRPPKQVSDLSLENYALLLVDFDLRTAYDNDGGWISYYGTTLASEMRMRYQSCPVVIVTRRNYLTQWNGPLLEESLDVDYLLLKDVLILHERTDEERRKLISLTDGFKALNDIRDKPWSKVLELLGATEDELNNLREANPPLHDGKWNIPQTSRWIRNTLLRYPGIFYNDLYAAARLGISRVAFLNQAEDYFLPAQYTGMFKNFGRFWWRDRLLQLAQELLLKHPVSGDITKEFGPAFASEFNGEKLAPSICIYDGTPIADWVCHILEEPVKLQNSIPYYPDNRPTIMEQARVSFKAIQDDERFDESLVDADSLKIVQKLWS